jgi:hypothetical protein
MTFGCSAVKMLNELNDTNNCDHIKRTPVKCKIDFDCCFINKKTQKLISKALTEFHFHAF